VHDISIILKINAELVYEISDNLSGLVVGENHQIVMEVDELKKILNLEVEAVRLDGWCHQDDVVVEVFVELLDYLALLSRSGDESEFQSVVSSSHLPDMVKEDGVRLQSCPGVNDYQSSILALVLDELGLNKSQGHR
jgi:hypothetical protein|tara:strand:+ start:78 stop:488 length:411 start_codon:yes stop_codon:yes gene_type:complete